MLESIHKEYHLDIILTHDYTHLFKVFLKQVKGGGCETNSYDDDVSMK